MLSAYSSKLDDDGEEVQRLLRNVDQLIQDHRDGKFKPMASYGKLVWTLSDCQDQWYFCLGILWAILSGLGLPSFVFLFGDIADSFQQGADSKEVLEKITRISKILTVIGLGIWVGCYIFFSFLTIASERIGLKTKTSYLRSILR